MQPNLVLRTLSTLLDAISPLQIPVAVAGGIAISYWGNPRSTQDIDLAMSTVPPDGLNEILLAAGLRQKRNQPKSLGLFTLHQWVLDLEEEFVEMDVDLMVGTSEYYQQFFKQTSKVKLEGVSRPINVLSREDLIIHKLYAGRLIDQADVSSLLEAHYDELNHDYLREWIGTLELKQEWSIAEARYRDTV